MKKNNETSSLTIGIDVAGAEVLEKTLYEAGTQALERNFSLQFYGTEPLSPSCIVCTQAIAMDDAPSSFRKKKNSTLVRALQDLDQNKIAALVTCANTGVVVSAASIYLGRFIPHPALAATIPSQKGKVIVLDAGALPTARAENLLSYAMLGSKMASCHLNIPFPKVGILNIGRERKKGTEELQKTDTMLRERHNPFSYVGFVEPIDVFSGEVDVLVTSGFTGNIFLKTAEGVATTLCHQRTAESGGALLVGVKRPLIKCHGKPTKASFMQAIVQAYEYASSGLIHKLQEHAFPYEGL